MLSAHMYLYLYLRLIGGVAGQLMMPISCHILFVNY